MRFKLRWLMIAVTVIAILIGPGYRYYGVLRQRANHYRGMAQWQELQAKANSGRSRIKGWSEESRERSRKVGEWYLSRRDRYLRAARFRVFEVPVEWEPWATVPYRDNYGRESPRPDPAPLWPRNAEEQRRQGEAILRAEAALRARQQQ